MIAVTHLDCGYQTPVLENVSFTAQRDICILGANGVGKSTLAKALSGLIPSAGEIMIDGADLAVMDAAARAKAITYIPPKLESFDSRISVYEFVLMGRYPFKEAFASYSKADEAYVRSLIASTPLGPEHAISELSSGQQQILLITQALAQQSRIVIFDEPTANLDPHHAKVFYDALMALPETTQKVVITHDLNLARQLGFDVLFLESGAARLYREAESFFERENLERCYGVAFHVNGATIGVAYD